MFTRRPNMLRKGVIPGGEADKKHVAEKDVDPEQLKMGIKEEMEHTGDPKVAKEIALDHLSKTPNYYSKLKKYVEKD